MEAGEPPVFIYCNAPNSDKIHNPKEAIKLRDRAKQLGIPCVALSAGRNDLPKAKSGTNWLEMQLKFCDFHLKAAKAKAKKPD